MSDETHLERTAEMKAEASGAERKAIADAYEDLKREAGQMQGSTIKAANLARQIGILFQAWCGHELLDKTFWRRECAELPLDYETAQICVSVARKMPEPAKDLADAFPFTRAIHESAKQLELVERTEDQARCTVSLIQRFLVQITTERQLFKKAVSERPMTSWDSDALEIFIADTEWLADERARAEGLLRQKVK